MLKAVFQLLIPTISAMLVTYNIEIMLGRELNTKEVIILILLVALNNFAVTTLYELSR